MADLYLEVILGYITDQYSDRAYAWSRFSPWWFPFASIWARHISWPRVLFSDASRSPLYASHLKWTGRSGYASFGQDMLLAGLCQEGSL